MNITMLDNHFWLPMVLDRDRGNCNRLFDSGNILAPKFHKFLNQFRLLKPGIVTYVQDFSNLIELPGGFLEQLLFCEIHDSLPSFASTRLRDFQETTDSFLERREDPYTVRQRIHTRTHFVHKHRVLDIRKVHIHVCNRALVSGLQHR